MRSDPLTNIPFKIWEAYTASFDERGDNIGTIGFFSSNKKAEEVAKTHSGPSGRIKYHWAIRVFSQESRKFHVFLLRDDNPVDLDLTVKEYDEKIKQNAIAKLTSEECRVLGLKK